MLEWVHGTERCSQRTGGDLILIDWWGTPGRGWGEESARCSLNLGGLYALGEKVMFWGKRDLFEGVKCENGYSVSDDSDIVFRSACRTKSQHTENFIFFPPPKGALIISFLAYNCSFQISSRASFTDDKHKSIFHYGVWNVCLFEEKKKVHFKIYLRNFSSLSSPSERSLSHQSPSCLLKNNLIFLVATLPR